MSHKRLKDALRAGACIDNGALEEEEEKSPVQIQNGSSDENNNNSHHHNPVVYSDDVKDFPNCSRVTLNSIEKWGIYSLRYGPDGRKLAAGFGNGGIVIIDHATQKVTNKVQAGKAKALAVTALQFHPRNKNQLLSAGASGFVTLWDVNANNDQEDDPPFLEEKGNEINSLDLCMDGLLFATCGKDRHIRLYDTERFVPYHTIEAPDNITMTEINTCSGHTHRVFALKFHPSENNIFLTAGWDDCVKVWDKRILSHAVQSIPGPHICGAALDVRDREILCGSWSAKNALQSYDIRNGKLLKNHSFPVLSDTGGEFLYCAQFLSNQLIIAGGSGTNSACVINKDTGKAVGKIQSNKPVIAVDSTEYGKTLAIGGIKGNLILADI